MEIRFLFGFSGCYTNSLVHRNKKNSEGIMMIPSLLLVIRYFFYTLSMNLKCIYTVCIGIYITGLNKVTWQIAITIIHNTYTVCISRRKRIFMIYRTCTMTGGYYLLNNERHFAYVLIHKIMYQSVWFSKISKVIGIVANKRYLRIYILLSRRSLPTAGHR